MTRPSSPYSHSSGPTENDTPQDFNGRYGGAQFRYEAALERQHSVLVNAAKFAGDPYVADLTAEQIKAMPMSEWARLREKSGLADSTPTYVASTPPAGPPAELPRGQYTDDVPDFNSPEFFHAWRSRRVSGGEGKGIFHSVGSQSPEYTSATRAQAGRTAYSQQNVIEPPRLTGRYVRQDDMRDTRTAAERFGNPANSFNL